jgi:hypothetical protein
MEFHFESSLADMNGILPPMAMQVFLANYGFCGDPHRERDQEFGVGARDVECFC